MLRFRVALIGISTAGLLACGDDKPATLPPASLTPESSAGASGNAGAPSTPPTPGENEPPAAAGAGGSGATGAGAGGGAAGDATAGGAAGEAPDDGAPGAGAVSGDAGPAVPTGPLPDLVLDAAYLIDTTIEDTINIADACLMNEGCVTGLGERRIVRFGSRTGNIGTAAFLLGKPEEGNPFWTYDACQDSYDLVGFAFYELFDSAGTRVLTGVKNGFCIRDSEPWELEGGPSCRDYDCNRQGIDVGCADNYGSELQCQWVDITGLPAGDYSLRVTVNANRATAELDYSNNVVNVNLQILDDEVRVLP
ncbi:MAG TPA: lysyl oxidase family protein [Polyangiaceae bacterium]|nr:lysyl oxidase family protein [Polyangiaceae bacterium]